MFFGQSSSLHQVNTIGNMGFKRAGFRLGREVRRQLVYPWVARYLFPMPKMEDNGLIRPTILGTFQGDTRAHDGHKTELLQLWMIQFSSRD